MGITNCTSNTCCEKNNVILQTHTVYRKENSSKIKNSNSKSGLNKSINESISESINNSISKNDSISESKSDDESDNEEKQKQFAEKLYKTGILRNDNKTIDGKEQIDCMFIDSYDNKNNFFYYLKKVILIQKLYKKHFQKKIKKKKSRKKEFGKLHINFVETKKKNQNNKIDQESNLFYNISKTKLSFINIMTNAQTKGAKMAMVPFNLNSKRQIKYRYYGQYALKKIENYLITPEIKRTNSLKNNLNSLLQKPKKQSQIKSGYGRIEYNDKSTFQGIFSNNKANGIGHYQDNINGNFIGEYLNNEPNGYGIYNNGGLQVEGNYISNYLIGIGIEISDDDTKYEGEFSNSTKNGVGTFKWADGTIYRGNFVNNEMTGFGIIEYNDGKLYQGGMLNGTMNGYGEFYWSDGKRYYGNYENDKRNGFGIFIWVLSPLECYVGFFENGLFNGVGIKISGDNVKYGIWKRQEREKWVKGPWEFENHIHKKENLKYMSIFQLKHVKLFEYINHFCKMEIFCSEDNHFFK